MFRPSTVCLRVFLVASVIILVGLAPPLVQGQEDADAVKERNSNFPGGAHVGVNEELQQLTERARRFVEDERFDLASVLWSRVLLEIDGGAVALTPSGRNRSVSNRYQRHQSLARHIHREMAKQGHAQFRKQYDEEAGILLKDKEGLELERAQSSLVHNYFFTSPADEAALVLAKSRLQSGEYYAAARALKTLTADYPQPDIDIEQARKLLDAANTAIEDPAAGTAQLKKLLGMAAPDAPEAGAWTMSYGRADRSGAMPPLAKEAIAKPLTSMWNIDTLASHADRSVPDQLRRFFPPRAPTWPNVLEAPPGPSADTLAHRWAGSSWHPSATLLLKDGRVYYKSNRRIVCRDAASGKLIWMGRAGAVRDGEAASKIWAESDRSRPQNQAEIDAFGDRIFPGGMTIVGGTLYDLGGALADQIMPRKPRAFGQADMDGLFPWRDGRIYAYNTKNGKFKWQAVVNEPRKREAIAVAAEPTGFIAAPTPYRDWLLAPSGADGHLWLYAIRQADGNVVWRRRLCNVSGVLANPWTPPAVAVVGGEVYLTTGAGVIFALDALTGHVHWAVQYQRNIELEADVHPFRRQFERKLVPGWDQDFLFVHGKQLVVLPSDADMAFALDRASGELRWDTPRRPTSDDEPARYALGMVGGDLFLAGDNVVRCYSLKKDGRLNWEAKIPQAFARGALTSDAIYMPGGKQIHRLELTSGKPTDEIKVSLPGRAPLGNLYTDGHRLFAAGPTQLHVLSEVEGALKALKLRIDAGDPAALLQRMRIHAAASKLDAALADAQALFGSLLKLQPQQSHDELLLALRDAQLAKRAPLETLRLLARAERELKESQAKVKVSTTDRNQLVTACLGAIAIDQPTGSIGVLLNSPTLFSQPYLRQRAVAAVAAVKDGNKGKTLRAALKSDEPATRALAAMAVGDTADDAPAELRPLLEDENARVRLAAAAALGQHGDRAVLAPLVKMLASNELNVRARSSGLLRSLTGQRFGFVAYGTRQERDAAAEKWNAWLKEHGGTVKLRPAHWRAPVRGRTLICYYAQGKVVELDKDGKEVWSARVPYAWGCQGLSSGHRVVASYSGRYVVEFDAEGREVWKSDRLPGAPFSVQRLENGNTLVTCGDSQKVFEITPDKKIAWETEVRGRPMDAKRLDNGNTLIALQSGAKVVEVDRGGKVVWELNRQSGVLAASRLDNGNTLICRQGSNEVVEVNQQGDVVWKQSGLKNPYDAQRLPNGNTLIVDYNGVREVTPDSRTLWQHRQSAASRVHRY